MGTLDRTIGCSLWALCSFFKFSLTEYRRTQKIYHRRDVKLTVDLSILNRLRSVCFFTVIWKVPFSRSRQCKSVMRTWWLKCVSLHRTGVCSASLLGRLLFSYSSPAEGFSRGPRHRCGPLVSEWSRKPLLNYQQAQLYNLHKHTLMFSENIPCL